MTHHDSVYISLFIIFITYNDTSQRIHHLHISHVSLPVRIVWSFLQNCHVSPGKEPYFLRAEKSGTSTRKRKVMGQMGNESTCSRARDDILVGSTWAYSTWQPAKRESIEGKEREGKSSVLWFSEMHLVCASGVGWLHAYVYIIRTDGMHRLSGPMGPLSAISLRRPHIYCSNTARASSAWVSSTAFCLLIILRVWSRPVRQEECWPRTGVSTPLVFDDETVPQGATGSNAQADLLEMCDTWADRKEVGWLYKHAT